MQKTKFCANRPCLEWPNAWSGQPSLFPRESLPDRRYLNIVGERHRQDTKLSKNLTVKAMANSKNFLKTHKDPKDTPRKT